VTAASTVHGNLKKRCACYDCYDSQRVCFRHAAPDRRGRGRSETDEYPEVAPPVGGRTEGRYVAFREGIKSPAASCPAAFIVEFDVAVTISKKTDVDAKGGIAVHVFEAGAKRTSSAEHSSVSRIKFGVPVTYARMGI